MRVPIVEADLSRGTSLQHSLLMLDHEPMLVGTAEAALWRLERERPDGVLLAARLPDLTGGEPARLARVRELGVPIVVIAEAGETDAARAAGVLEVLERPLTLERLKRALETTAAHHAGMNSERAAAGEERRRSPRAALVVPVTVVDGSGRRQAAMSMNLSTYGIKLASPAPLRDLNVVKLVFTPPDGDGRLTAMGVLVREDRDGYAFSFVDLPQAHVVRLAALVARLAG